MIYYSPAVTSLRYNMVSVIMGIQQQQITCTNNKKKTEIKGSKNDVRTGGYFEIRRSTGMWGT